MKYEKNNQDKSNKYSKYYKKKLKVCLIHPYSKVPPYGILSMASVLEKNEIKVKIADYNIHNVKEERILRDIEGADIIGLSVWSMPMILDAIRITKVIKNNTNAFMIWGGVHPSLFAEQVIKEFNLDAVCKGEGEETIVELITALQEGKDIKKVKELYIKNEKNEENIIYTGARENIIDLPKLPGYAWHKINIKKYIYRNLVTGKKSIAIVESRGCPFNCSFCYVNKMFGRQWRGRTVDQIINEIKFLNKKYGIQHFDFFDDLPFGGDKKKLYDFCEKITPLKIEWSCEYRVDLITEELVQVLKKANCTYVYLGVESGSTKTLKRINKVGVTPKKSLIAANLLFKAGVNCMSGFIMGLPGETNEDIMKTYRLAKKIKATRIRVSTYVPYPGTELYEEVKRMGFKEPKRTANWAFVGNYARSKINFSEVPLWRLQKLKRKMELISIWNSLLFSFYHWNFSYLPYFILDSLPQKSRDKIVKILRKITR